MLKIPKKHMANILKGGVVRSSPPARVFPPRYIIYDSAYTGTWGLNHFERETYKISIRSVDNL